jgi:ATP-dependent DNA helicase RecG
MSALSLNDTITKVSGVGSITAEKLDKLDIETVFDLLHHFPSRYLDFSTPVVIRNLEVGKTQSFVAIIGNVSSFFTKNGKLLIQATAKDASGKIILTWFNNPYIKRLIKENTEYTIAGKVTFWGRSLTIVAPIIEEGSTPSINTRGLVPIYPLTKGITSKWLRTKIDRVIPDTEIVDPLESELLESLDLIPEETAFRKIHFPKTKIERLEADKRLSFNEHLRINIDNRLELLGKGDSISIEIKDKITQTTRKAFPFTLTPDQDKTVLAIYKNLQSKEYTHRLIQGDTGSGKTATIIFAAAQSLENGYSCALMAPTEILANQHYKTFCSILPDPKQIQLITGSVKERIISHKPMVYIGTHSLLTGLPPKLTPPLAFVAIDEQHKFGVNQREELMNRSPMPHLFNLSATPIPRTVALGLLGDIHISNISQKPLNRLRTKTYVVSPTHFKKSPTWLTNKLEEGGQIFVVCPQISEHQSGVASIETVSRIYRKMIPDQFSIFVIHGKMKPDDQNAEITKFKNQKGSVLIATSLVEVGIDIPTANIMIIHSAERFGLASLHQLRGRVGRDKDQGYCFLVPSTDDEEETERLQLLRKYRSGLILAQKDLRLRGAGEVFGIKQHGTLPTRLHYFWSKKLFLLAKNLSKTLVGNDPKKAARIAIKLKTC